MAVVTLGQRDCSTIMRLRFDGAVVLDVNASLAIEHHDLVGVDVGEPHEREHSLERIVVSRGHDGSVVTVGTWANDDALRHATRSSAGLHDARERGRSLRS